MANYQITPAPTKIQLPSNYISYYDFTSQYLPEVHEELACIYGNQSISGMLYMFGAESSFASDTFKWTEEGRLHFVYKNITRSGNSFTQANHAFRKNDVVVVSDGIIKRIGIVLSLDKDTFELEAYKNSGFAEMTTTKITAFKIGSEFRKGTEGMQGSLQTNFSVLENKPVIIKDHFEVSGSDATQIGWIKTKGGYLWYLKDEDQTRMRLEDYFELQMLIAEKAETGSAASAAGYDGTEGMFEAIRTRGHSVQGILTELEDWEERVKINDKEGKIRDNMVYCNRLQSIAIDKMLGTINAGYDGGLSYGIFNNDKDMVVNLGFKGFTIGTYNFWKTDWKLLNDPTTLGALEGTSKVNGVIIPIGTKEVYEGEYKGNGLGTKITTPFLEMKYRKAGNEDRKYKTWVLGTVGSVKTNSNDNMEVHYLSERMLNVVGANNFTIIEG